MFGNKLYLAVLSTNMAFGVCYDHYNLFQGFGHTPAVILKTLWWDVGTGAGKTTVKTKLVSTTVNDETPTIPTTATSGRKEINFTSDYNFYLTTPEAKHWNWKPKINVKQFNMKCPENELPSSIGTYVIPTQRDLVLFTQRTLLKMFNGYHEKTLLLLKDIKEATRATVAVEKKCRSKRSYKLCVKEVNKKFVSVTKELVQSLERQEAEVVALTEGKICNLTSMKTNPIQLIKILAMDEASLDFALPAFLRLLGGCTVHCTKPASPDHRPRLRQMTDQELVVKHFLTNKNYLQLLEDKYVV